MKGIIKRISLYGFIVVFFTALAFWLFSAFNKTLEDYLIGEWTERHWEYKAANKYLLKGLGLGRFQDELESNIRVHAGEKWFFKPNGELEILSGDTLNKANWSLKGRGNILEISDGDLVEHFEIKKYGSRQMELVIISDLQIKESARIIFEQVK